MADAESFSHSGIRCSADVRAGKAFYEEVLGADPHNWIGLNTDDLLHARGPHPCVIASDFLFVTFPQAAPLRPGPSTRRRQPSLGHPNRSSGTLAPKRGIGGARHAFAVPRARFGEFIEHLKATETEFEGPVTHPDHGPLGESVYFTDTIGNYFEVCWRRDEDAAYHQVIVGGD